MKKIFIAGCARSGTSLTRNLMGCFTDTYALPHEARVEEFQALEGTAPNVVVKRTAGSFKRLANLEDAVNLIYCLRHPVDVLTSTHTRTAHLRRFHVTPDRWDGEYNALQALRKRQPKREICYVRYEDLIRTPDIVQGRIARAFDLSIDRLFSADPENPILGSSLEKWRTHEDFLDYVLSLPPDFLDRVGLFCAEFGYEMPHRA